MLENWETLKLEDCIDILTGFPFKSKHYSDDSSDIALIRGDNVIQGRLRLDDVKRWKISEEDKLDNYFLKENDVVLAMDRPWIEAGLKYSTITEKDLPCLLVQRVARLRAKNNLNQNFLRYVIGSSWFTQYILAVQTGTAVPHISSKQIKDFEFICPPIEEQRRIAEILSSLDEKIELNLEMNRTLEKIAQAIFKQLNESSEKVRLKDYVELNPRLSIRKNQNVRYVEMKDLPESGASVKGYVFRPFTAGSKFQQFDTLLARITPCLENGKTAFVDFLNKDEIAFGSTEFIVMRAKPSISSYYVYLLARNYDFREMAIKSMVGTSGRQRVQVDMLENFQLDKVETREMEIFHSTVTPLFEKIRQNSIQIKTLTQIRDNLLPKLMSGKIRV